MIVVISEGPLRVGVGFFEIRGSVFDFSRPSAVHWRCFLLNLKRDNRGAGLWKKFSQSGEMVWKKNKGIATWCEETQGSWVVIYLPAR